MKIMDLKNLSDFQNHAYVILCEEDNRKSEFALKLAETFLKSQNVSIHPDLTIVNPDDAKNPKIAISTIQEMRKSSQMSSNMGGKKVFIINSADKMTIQAQNALLKTLEEPSENTILILTAVSEQTLLPTITSRCQRIKIPKLSINKIKENFVENDSGEFTEIIKILKDEDLIIRFQKANDFSSPKNTNKFLNSFEIIFRDLLHLKIGIQDDLIYSQDIENLIEISKKYSIIKILQVLTEIKKVKKSIKQNVNSKFAFENLMLTI
jgi:DNA polymerase-3 subunit delta'